MINFKTPNIIFLFFIYLNLSVYSNNERIKAIIKQINEISPNKYEVYSRFGQLRFRNKKKQKDEDILIISWDILRFKNHLIEESEEVRKLALKDNIKDLLCSAALLAPGCFATPGVLICYYFLSDDDESEALKLSYLAACSATILGYLGWFTKKAFRLKSQSIEKQEKYIKLANEIYTTVLDI